MVSSIRISVLTSPVLHCSPVVGTHRIYHLGPKGTPIGRTQLYWSAGSSTRRWTSTPASHLNLVLFIGFVQKLLHNHLSYLCVHFSAVHGLLQQHLIILLLVDLFLLHSWSLPLPYHYPVWFACPQSSYLFILIPLS